MRLHSSTKKGKGMPPFGKLDKTAETEKERERYTAPKKVKTPPERCEGEGHHDGARGRQKQGPGSPTKPSSISEEGCSEKN